MILGKALQKAFIEWMKSCHELMGDEVVAIDGKTLTAKELHDATRSHWLIESMHWQLDVGLKEDTCRIRVDDRAEVFARIRQMVLNLLKQEKSFKAGIQRKRMMCAMDQEYLATMLGSLS